MRNLKLGLLVAATALLGCSRTVEPMSVETDDLVDQVLQDLENHRSAAQKAHETAAPANAATAGLMEVSHRETSRDFTSSEPAEQDSPATPLRYEIGDRFPIVKTTQQVVGPPNASADPSANATSAITWQYLLSVVDVAPSSILFRLKFERVASEYIIGNQRIRFDSAQNASNNDPTFAEVQALVGLEIDFTVATDQRVPAIVSENDFLHKLASRLQANQQNVGATIIAKVRSGGITDLLDSTIGLVPAGRVNLSPGTTWTREVASVSGTATTTARVESTDNRQQTISTSSRFQPQPLSGQVAILSGGSQGRGTFDSDTGLPLQFTRNSVVDLQIAQPGGQSIVRRKQVTETIQTFSNQRGPVARTSTNASNQIQQVSGIQATGRSVVPASQVESSANGLSSTAVANYSD